MAEVDLKEDCISHGQFYITCSRLSAASNLIISAYMSRTYHKRGIQRGP